jgi:hypothetical protein
MRGELRFLHGISLITLPKSFANIFSNTRLKSTLPQVHGPGSGFKHPDQPPGRGDNIFTSFAPPQTWKPKGRLKGIPEHPDSDLPPTDVLSGNPGSDPRNPGSNPPEEIVLDRGNTPPPLGSPAGRGGGGEIPPPDNPEQLFWGTGADRAHVPTGFPDPTLGNRTVPPRQNPEGFGSSWQRPRQPPTSDS